MPARPSHLPTHLERIALQKLLTGELPSAKLRPTSSRIIGKLVAKGWIERGSAPRIYRITAAGEAAMRAKLPSGADSS
jgi:hypothetical protein